MKKSRNLDEMEKYTNETKKKEYLLKRNAYEDTAPRCFGAGFCICSKNKK